MFYLSPKQRYAKCAIYRGAGGSGDAVEDSASEAILTVQARDAAIAAQAAAEAAQTAAEAAQTAAELAETNAETAETNAETAETNAETAATNAASSASAASTSATNAASSASSASTSATNAANSYNSTLAIFGNAAAVAAAVTAAQTAETNAETAETNAETAETNAANSASNASTSAASASSSASSASSSASSASSSASTATTQATNASNSASAASTSATNASNSASAASTSATNAANSATSAQTAETNAETAETNAAASASSASTSASNASTSASNAATSATNASNSASSASTSATNASNSASSAATSATNAANSATLAASYTPSQTGNAGKYLTTNGTATSWDTIDTGDISGLGTIATQNANAVAITGGTINGTTIGATTPSSIVGTTITGQTGVLRGTGTNLVLQSQTFDNASWTKSQTSVSATLYTDPLGGTTANNLIEAATTAVHFTGGTVSITSGINYTFSVYLKKGIGATAPDWIQLTFGFGGFGTSPFVNFNLATGAVGTAAASVISSSITSVGNDWYRCSITATSTSTSSGNLGIIAFTNNSNSGRLPSYAGAITSDVLVWGAQIEIGSTLNTYIPTTTTAVYGTPTLSFSGVSTLGLESNGALFLQPALTGAIQAQATTSTTIGGNARGAYAVDLQMQRGGATRVASATNAFIGAGYDNIVSGGYSAVVSGYSNGVTGVYSSILGGDTNLASGTRAVIAGGILNTASGTISSVIGGYSNTAAGFYSTIGGGYANSGTANAAVTTQSGTMNGTTAVTLSGSNANIKVGQLITGTSINTFPNTYVAAISGTSLTLSQVASGSSTSTLSFFTPHGVVVGGGNNQATGAYSFIGGGGDAGTAANRNVASGDWSTVCGGAKNTASGIGSFVGGGGTDGATFDGHLASGAFSTVAGGYANKTSGSGSAIGGGNNNSANANYSTISGGRQGIARSIIGNFVTPACSIPLGNTSGLTQSALLVLAVQTTDATATALRSDSGAASGTNQVILPNNSAYYFRGEIISGVTGGGNTKGWFIEGVIKRGANAASTALVGTPTVTSNYADAGASTWAIAVTADTTNGGLRITFTGQASTTIRTVAQIRTTEMTY